MKGNNLVLSYTPGALYEKDGSYLAQIKKSLEEEKDALDFTPLTTIEEGHDNILVASIEEVLGENRFSSPRGIIVSFNGAIDEKNADKVKKIFSKKLLGFLDISQPSMIHVPLFRRLIFENKVLGNGEGEDGQAHLGKILEQSLVELQRVKKLHEKVVPLRHEKIKNINLFSKFAAGYSSGGEFFDIKKDEKQIVILVTHAQSYVASSIVLSHFEQFQKLRDVNKEKIEDFLEELIDECRELDLIDRDTPEALQLDILRLDLRTFEYEGYHFGNGAYFSNGAKLSNENKRALNENFFEEAHYEGVLERGEKLIYASPGVIQNFVSRDEHNLLEKVVEQQYSNGPREILNEIFFQLKKNTDEDFLKFDSSVIYLEVDAHAFFQV